MASGAPGHADSSGRRVRSLRPRGRRTQVVLGLVRHKVLLTAHPDHPPWQVFGHALQHSMLPTWHPRAHQCKWMLLCEATLAGIRPHLLGARAAKVGEMAEGRHRSAWAEHGIGLRQGAPHGARARKLHG